MKKFKIITYVMLAIGLLSGCVSGNNYDELILTDPNTGKQYLIHESVIKISGTDTIIVFE